MIFSFRCGKEPLTSFSTDPFVFYYFFWIFSFSFLSIFFSVFKFVKVNFKKL